MALKDDVEDTMAAFSELIGNLGRFPTSVSPFDRWTPKDDDVTGILYVTVDQAPGPDRAFAVDKQTGIEATLSDAMVSGNSNCEWRGANCRPLRARWPKP